MEFIFLINGERQTEKLGVVEGYIQEGINEVSLIELILVSTSPLSDADCKGYIGKNITLAFGDTIDGDTKYARFDGLAFEFHILDTASVERNMFKYQMIVRPKLWALNYNVVAKSFPKTTKPAVIEDVLKVWKLSPDVDYEIHCQSPKKDAFLVHKQILQNQISDLSFIRNLMSESGMNFFFYADKAGEDVEKLKIVNNVVFFGKPTNEVIPYNPEAGQVADESNSSPYRMTSMETHYRATIQTVATTAELGDGSINPQRKKKDIKEGHFGAFQHFSADGENGDVADNHATSHMQFFKANQVVFEGRSNYFLLRPGERFLLRDEAAQSNRDVLMTHLFHHFKQTTSNALSSHARVDYTNLFTGVDGTLDYRPNQAWGKTTVAIRRMFSQAHSIPREDHFVEKTDIEDIETYTLKRKIAKLQTELSVTKELLGLMVGTVSKDAWVTDGNELVCEVKNERFPEGLVIKIALGWLVQHGWLSLLPREGAQVYFQFINGSGGQNEAVLVGYRPTASMPTLDPAKTTASTQLGSGEAPKLGEPAEKVVGKSEFSPSNKYRQALLGESGVAEVAVIDGGEDTVYLHANNRICVIGDKSVSISTGSLCESAGSASQQFGSLNRGVKNDQKVSISGSLERSVNGTATEKTKGDLKIESTTGFVDVFGNSKIELHNTAKSAVSVAQTKVTLSENGGNQVVVNPGEVKATAGSAKMVLTKNTSSELKLSGDGFKVDASLAKVNAGGHFLEVKKDGTVTLKGVNVEIKGSNVHITGSSKVSIDTTPTITLKGTTAVNIDGGGATIGAAGGILKLNG